MLVVESVDDEPVNEEGYSDTELQNHVFVPSFYPGLSDQYHGYNVLGGGDPILAYSHVSMFGDRVLIENINLSTGKFWIELQLDLATLAYNIDVVAPGYPESPPTGSPLPDIDTSLANLGLSGDPLTLTLYNLVYDGASFDADFVYDGVSGQFVFSTIHDSGILSESSDIQVISDVEIQLQSQNPLNLANANLGDPLISLIQSMTARST